MSNKPMPLTEDSAAIVSPKVIEQARKQQIQQSQTKKSSETTKQK